MSNADPTHDLSAALAVPVEPGELHVRGKDGHVRTVRVREVRPAGVGCDGAPVARLVVVEDFTWEGPAIAVRHFPLPLVSDWWKVHGSDVIRAPEGLELARRLAELEEAQRLAGPLAAALGCPGASLAEVIVRAHLALSPAGDPS